MQMSSSFHFSFSFFFFFFSFLFWMSLFCFLFFVFSFFDFLCCGWACYLFFSFLFFPGCCLHFFYFLVVGVIVVLFCFFFFFFFFGYDFYFLINWVIFFFSCLSLFCINWLSFFNKGVWVNLYKLIFLSFYFFTSNQTKKRKIKSFLSSHYFLSSHFFTIPTKRTLNITISQFLEKVFLFPFSDYKEKLSLNSVAEWHYFQSLSFSFRVRIRLTNELNFSIMMNKTMHMDHHIDCQKDFTIL